MSNKLLAEALFQLADSYPPGDRRLAFLRAAYAVFDAPQELGPLRRPPEGIPWEAMATVSLLARCRGTEALWAATARFLGPRRNARRAESRQGFLSAAEVNQKGLEDKATRLRGAAHVHTRSSDGAGSLETMARALQRRGYFWGVVTDHTQSLACVNGLDQHALAIQRGAIARWNEKHGEELTLFAGAECEILEDGSLDIPRDRRSELLILAAVHTNLASRRDQTSRYLRALDEPGVWALAHPKGRLFARRSGLRVNWEKVFVAAAERGVLLEINGFPRRQDLDPTLAGLALEQGCFFLLGSDAHHPRHLIFDRWALAIALAAGIPEDRIVNFQKTPRL